jgi:protein-S-isoprenylcysteine O-methyltransferase Ste14
MPLLAIFLAASAGIIALSWRSLRVPRSHGFYRFFAFEVLAALILLNSPYWFREPLSARQVASWVLLAASLGLAMEGFRLIREIGKPARVVAGGTKLAFENTTHLVTVGLYRFIRHPLYSSLLFMAWGAFLKDVSLRAAGLALAASAFLSATALAEERENLAQFGPSYAAYMKTTRRFIPFAL